MAGKYSAVLHSRSPAPYALKVEHETKAEVPGTDCRIRSGHHENDRHVFPPSPLYLVPDLDSVAGKNMNSEANLPGLRS